MIYRMLKLSTVVRHPDGYVRDGYVRIRKHSAHGITGDAGDVRAGGNMETGWIQTAELKPSENKNVLT